MLCARRFGHEQGLFVSGNPVDLLDDELLPPSPKPQAGEKLFCGDLLDGESEHVNACPHRYADGSNWSLIAEGYLNAANALVRCLLDREVGADEMLYPACFLYRQYIELRLKHVILLGYRQRKLEQGVPIHHDLQKLWAEALPVLLKQVQGPNRAELETIGAQILELQGIDPGSDEFRYPVNKDKNVSLDGLQYVNLRHMRDVMKAMDMVFSGSVEYLFEAIQQEAWF